MSVEKSKIENPAIEEDDAPGLVFDKTGFRSLVREIMQDMSTEVDTAETEAIAALQDAAEKYIEGVFRETLHVLVAENRDELRPGDLTNVVNARHVEEASGESKKRSAEGSGEPDGDISNKVRKTEAKEEPK